MNPRNTAINDLNNSGYQFKRSGGNHDIYYNPETKCSIPLKRGHFDEDDLRYIRKEANIPAASSGVFDPRGIRKTSFWLALISMQARLFSSLLTRIIQGLPHLSELVRQPLMIS